jgi:tellurite resistance-related uncharacterized protein
MKQLPDNVYPYKKTKVFDENTIPEGILNDHRTLEGVWGKIKVLEGELNYIIQSNPVEEIKLSPEKFGVVEPQVIHHVKPLGKVSFYVEFYK